MPKDCFHIAALSDLHAYETAEPGVKPSHLCVSSPDNEPTKHPLAGLRKLIVDTGMKANMLLCPGDLGDKAQPSAIKYAWSEVHNIKTHLNASHILATVGNHDVDSRHKFSSHDPKGFLQSLVPPFPFDDINLNDKFWSRNFALHEENNIRIIILNSSAFHGLGDEEYKHGRISNYTLSSIEETLKRSNTQPINILLCHHHPQQHMEVDLGDYDVMKNGQLLLDLLGSGTYGDWLVIHGHKHHPKITYASGGSSAPVIFSCGSVSATLYTELQTVARNQFYYIELPYALYPSIGFVGKFKAWDWASGVGWIPSRQNSGLPHIGGFGCRGNVRLLANRVKGILGSKSITWADLCSQMNELEYLIPLDQQQLFNELESQNVGIQLNADGVPSEVGLIK